MAAGRLGGYRDREFSGRESDADASRMKDYVLDRFLDADLDRNSGRDLRDRNRDRPMDVEKRDSLSQIRENLNGYRPSPLSSSSGGSGDDRGRRQNHGRLTDREPGELSSGSESDGEVPVPKTSDDRTPIIENGVKPCRSNGSQSKEEGTGDLKQIEAGPSPSKKRKFSPIVWDKDDSKRISAFTLKNRHDSPSSVPFPLPPVSNNANAQSDSRQMIREPTVLASPLVAKVSIVSHSDIHVDDDHDQQQVEEEEEEDYPIARNISSSRWADGNIGNDDDEMDAYVEEYVVSRKKNAPQPNMSEQLVHKKKVSPELGEVIMREGSEEAASKSSDSGRGQRDYQEVEVDGNSYMEIDEEEHVEDGYDHLLGSDTESEDKTDGIPEPSNPPHRCINMLQGCRSVDEFERLNKIDEGTYGVVYRAKDRKTGEIVALKKVKMEKELEGFPLTSLREINILLSFHHPSIVDVKEVVVGSSFDSIFMVMEYMEHDLKALMETMKHPFSQSEVKCLILQLLEGVKYLHDNWVVHRDLKTSNILLNNRGELKICDFGLARQYGSPLKPYTQLVVTLWYRAPELLLGAKEYSTAIDMWSLGCIMAEFLAKEPLFNGKTELDQLDKIFRILGTPNEKIWPGISKLPRYKPRFVNHPYNRLREKFPPTSFSGRPTLSEAGFDLLNKLLSYDPEKRLTAEAALNHPWFLEVPLPKSKDFMPTFPAQHAKDRRLTRIMKSPDPLQELRAKELQSGKLGTSSIFG